ncbi:oligosaccharide flippase family protein [Erythrobacter sp. SCSIO 43205]|uniref:oligosaccharide flippase family protein n=1 Tax=Erythrobacter sp. SCSIO 43205 TaxID=2779361 RepID=UPI001CA82CF2|nr:oligosaccharide flippase family protein [Erythrobacter sp. SCSIO 43205]UAB77724.1 oligosaccharide flippase family protein [Erythrobacter sp. SCSIO 43205]
MRIWLKDDVLRRVARNTGKLGIGKVAGAVLHLASIAITARVLDLNEFGLLMLFRSLAQGLAAVAKFQSWQAMVHFGAAAYETEAMGALRSLWIRLAIIDFVVGSAAMIVGALLALNAGEAFGIPAELAWVAALYCLIVPLQVAGTPTGILRLTDRFDLMAWQSLVTPSVRVIGVGIAYLFGAPLWAVVFAWVMSDILGDAFLWVCAIVVAKAKGILDAATQARSHPIPANTLWRYLLGTNFNASLQQGALPLLTLVIGSTLGASAAGTYRLAQTLLEAVFAPVELAMRSLFPEISKLQAATGARLKEVMRHVGSTLLFVSIPASLVLFIGADIIVSLVAGDEYSGAGTLLSILAWTLPAIFLTAICETFMLGSGKSLAPVLSRITIVGSVLVVMFLGGSEIGLTDLGITLLLSSYAGLLVLAIPTGVALIATRQSGPSR